MTFETLLFEKKDGIGVLKIHRPQALNALNSQVLGELNSFLDELDRDSQIKVLIITGSGEKSFVAGADIKELSSLSPQAARTFAERGQKTFRRFEILKIPVIGAINGFALGGGAELALSCDFLIASSQARFGLPEVSLGLLPGFGGTQRLARFVGLPMARELVFSGRQVKADEALRIGLVNSVVEPSALLSKAEEIAREIISRAPLAVQNAKSVINRGYDLGIDEGLLVEREAFSELFRTSDQREGTQAFLEKRPPHFKGE